VTTTARDVTFLPRRSALTVVGAEGSHLITPDGRRVLDAAGGAIVANVGYGRPEVVEAAQRSLGRIGYTVPPFATPEREALIGRLVDRWLPPGLTHAALVSGGSESTDAAIRVAHLSQSAVDHPEPHDLLVHDAREEAGEVVQHLALELGLDLDHGQHELVVDGEDLGDRQPATDGVEVGHAGEVGVAAVHLVGAGIGVRHVAGDVLGQEGCRAGDVATGIGLEEGADERVRAGSHGRNVPTSGVRRRRPPRRASRAPPRRCGGGRRR